MDGSRDKVVGTLLLRRRGKIILTSVRRPRIGQERFSLGGTLTREIVTRDEEAWSRSEAGELAECLKTQR